MTPRTVFMAILATLALALPAHGQANQAVHLQTKSGASAPLGFQIFCMRTPGYCQRDTRSEIALTEDTWATLNRVNRSVNAAITPRRRTTETWELGARAGDCKDYAMNKRQRLIDSGVPAGALRIAIATTSRGEGHAVLIVRTSSGDLVLDNLTGTIKLSNQANYNWIAMSSPDPRKWHAIG